MTEHQNIQARVDLALKSAIHKWGAEQQWRMVQEECGELIAAINRQARGREGSLIQLVEEIANVIIVIGQARTMCNAMAGDGAVEAAVVLKLTRLEERLEIDGEAIGGGEKEPLP